MSLSLIKLYQHVSTSSFPPPYECFWLTITKLISDNEDLWLAKPSLSVLGKSATVCYKLYHFRSLPLNKLLFLPWWHSRDFSVSGLQFLSFFAVPQRFRISLRASESSHTALIGVQIGTIFWAFLCHSHYIDLNEPFTAEAVAQVYSQRQFFHVHTTKGTHTRSLWHTTKGTHTRSLWHTTKGMHT